MGIKGITVTLALIAALAIPAMAEEAITRDDPAEERERFLLIPTRDPLVGFDATEMVWHSAQELLTSGGDALCRFAGLDNSLLGRSVHTALTLYFCDGMTYYSHEMAHQYLNGGARHFWLDWSDWSRLYPRFVEHSFTDNWDMDEFEYYMAHPNDTNILQEFVKTGEAGLYRNRLNSRFTARLAALAGGTTLTDAMAYYSNATYEFEYIIRYGDEPIGRVPTEYGIIHDQNDVNGYIENMGNLGIEISLDRWQTAAGLSVALSGQFWNSLYGAYRYIVHGELVTRTIEFGPDSGIGFAPPSFYLFPTVRGLYLETETYLRGLFDPADLVFISFGSGLDLFGIEKTGPVDRMRLGAAYHPSGTLYFLEISPFLYLDFTGGMKQIGHSVGASVQTAPCRRFFLTATLEHNRADMIEQTIKFKDDGFYIIAGLGFRL